MASSTRETPEHVLVGEYTDTANRTGVSVIYFENGATAGVYKYGNATSTRQIDSLEPSHTVPMIDALVLSGGSAFGLDVCCGVMRWMRERGRGLDVGGIIIPIVPGAVIFDLRFSTGVTPDCDAGYAACTALSRRVHEGSFGAGTGATVGKINGIDGAMKSGVGCARSVLPGGVSVWTYVVVNAFGDVMDGKGGVMAGARKGKGSRAFVNTSKVISGVMSGTGNGSSSVPAPAPVSGNTTLCVVVTDALFDKPSLITIAKMASAGMARALSPAGASFDGDVVFAVSNGGKSAFIDAVGDASARLVEDAIRRAVMHADGFGILPAYRDLH